MHKPLLLASAVFAMVSTGLLAQTPPEPDLFIQEYASNYGVAYAEAASRIQRLAEINDVEKQLKAKHPNQFGGLYIEHKPIFRVVVKMTGNGQGLVKQITSDPLFVVEKAEIPVNPLHQLKDRVAKILANDGAYYFAVSVNVWDGVVEVRSTDMGAVKRVLPANLASDARIRFVPVTDGGSNTATIYGGKALLGTQQCTAGFTATSSSGAVEGILTTGHCDNSMTLSGVTFNMVERVYKNSTEWGFDMQFMRPSSGTHTFPSETYKSSTQREVIRRIDSPALGGPVCAYGSVTNAIKCGTLVAQFEVKRDNKGITNSVWRAAPNGTSAFVVGGDSGGPVYGPGVAYGMIKGTGDSSNPKHMSYIDISSVYAVGGFTLNTSIKTTP